jgi:hypothetical protein
MEKIVLSGAYRVVLGLGEDMCRRITVGSVREVQNDLKRAV